MYLLLCRSIVLVIKLIWGAYLRVDYMSILLKGLAVIRSFIHESFANFGIYDISGSITPILLRVCNFLR